MHKLAIYIPNFNGGGFLRRTIESLKKQTYKDFDVIVIDNKSDDNSRDIAFGYGAKIIEHKDHVSRIQNWNRCLDYFRQSDYDCMKFVFSGDTLQPNCIEEQIEKMKRFEFITCAHYVVENQAIGHTMRHFEKN